MADYKQCRECIKQDACAFKILKSKEIDCQYFIDKDVVPRVEVEDWKKNCDELYEQMSERLKEEVKIAVRLAKQEVAREIFNIIDNYIEIVNTTVDFDLEFLIKSIEELKNKYIGE